MTTLFDPLGRLDWVQVVATIRDKNALQVVTRMLQAQRTALESHTAQLKQMEETLDQHSKTLK